MFGQNPDGVAGAVLPPSEEASDRAEDEGETPRRARESSVAPPEEPGSAESQDELGTRRAPAQVDPDAARKARPRENMVGVNMVLA